MDWGILEIIVICVFVLGMGPGMLITKKNIKDFASSSEPTILPDTVYISRTRKCLHLSFKERIGVVSIVLALQEA